MHFKILTQIMEKLSSNHFVNQLLSTLGNVNKKGYDPVQNKWQRKVGMNRKKTFSTFLSQFHR